MDDPDYQRLLKLAHEGDVAATQRVLREATRRGDDGILQDIRTRLGFNRESVDSFTLTDTNAVEMIGVRHVRGDLIIESNSLHVLSELKRVDGKLIVENSLSLERLHLPNLARLGGALIENNQDLKEIALPSLAEIRPQDGEWFATVVLSNPELEWMKLPKLESIKCLGMSIVDNLKLQMLEFPKLRAIHFSASGAAVVRGNPQLTRIAFSALEEITPWGLFGGALHIECYRAELSWSPHLTQCSSLSIRGDAEELHLPEALEGADINIGPMSQLTRLRLPQEFSGRLFLSDVPALQSLESPSITTLRTLNIRDAPKLTRLEFPRLTEVEHLTVSETGLSSLEGIEQAKVRCAEIFGNDLAEEIMLNVRCRTEGGPTGSFRCGRNPALHRVTLKNAGVSPDYAIDIWSCLVLNHLDIWELDDCIAVRQVSLQGVPELEFEGRNFRPEYPLSVPKYRARVSSRAPKPMGNARAGDTLAVWLVMVGVIVLVWVLFVHVL